MKKSMSRTTFFGNFIPGIVGTIMGFSVFFLLLPTLAYRTYPAEENDATIIFGVT